MKIGDGRLGALDICYTNRDTEVSRECTLNPVPGSCKGYLSHYYFNINNHTGQRFLWTISWEQNRFDSKEECEDFCLKRKM